MPLVAYEPNPKRYEEVFASQVGYGPIVRYLGSLYQSGSGFVPQILKTLFFKTARFSKPIIAAAAPHAKKAFEAAQPHLRDAVTGLAKETTNRISSAIANKLAP